MICLVRHGEAEAGWGAAADPGLSALGAEQAARAAIHLRDIGARKAITSPMRRCLETAAPFANLITAQPRVEPAVSEIAAPADTADRVTWLRAIMSGTWHQAGETYISWRREMAGMINTLHEGTVVFTHFVAINALAGFFEGNDNVVLFRPGHCSVTRLERQNGRLRVAEWGSEASSRVL